MERFAEWRPRASGWLERDLTLLTDPSGWDVVLERPDLAIWSRPMPGDDNLLFRWRLPRVEAPADVLFEGFVRRVLEYHRQWTKEFTGGRVVETLGPEARVLYQRFDPGIPGISQRDLCSLEIVRDVGPGVKLASFRSVDLLDAEQGHERIDWWGAALATTLDDGASSELVYLDRENQGGWFPSWLMNRMMPRYLVLQAEAVRRFFAHGGPVALRALRPDHARAPVVAASAARVS